jgi:2'-5' RNA ligase
VTLAFLGETDPSAIDALTGAIEAVAAPREAFSLPTGQLGVFPSPRAARVLWYGVQDPDGSLAAAADDLRQALGLEATTVHPHVTVARARHRHGAVADMLLDGAEMPSGTLAVDRVRLYRSHVGAGPARYEVVAESRLGEGLNGSGPIR